MLRILLLLASLALLPIVLVLVVLAALQSGAVRDTATKLVGRLVPTVEIAGLGPGLPFRLELDRVALRDDGGDWLTVEDVRLRWSPGALLGGTVRVDEAGAARVHVLRAPAADPNAPPPEPPGEPFAWPDSVPRFALERLYIDELRLEPAVLGTPLALRLEASASSPTGNVIDLAFDAMRLDTPGLDANLRGRLDLSAKSLGLDLETADTSGFVAALAGDAALAPIQLSLVGNGPLNAWPARLEATLGQLADAGFDLVLGLEAPYRLEVAGSIVPGTAVAQDALADLLADGIELDLAVAPTADGVTLERLTLNTAWLEAEGTASLAGEAVVADLTARLADLAPLTPLAGMELAGAAALDVNLDGTLPLPTGTVTLTADDLALGELALRRVEQALRIEPGADDAARFNLDGRVDGLALSTANGTLTDDLTLTANGTVVPNGPFTLEALRLDGKLASLDAEASGDLGAGAVNATLRARLAELAALAPLVDGVPSGAVELELDARLTDQFTAGTVTVAGRAQDLAGLPEPVPALLGATPTLALDASLGDGPSVRLDRLQLDGSNLQVSGDGAVDLDGGPLAADLHVAVADLEAVGKGLGQDIGGSLDAQLTASGTLEAPDAVVALRLPDLVAGGQAFREVRLDATAAGALDDLGGTIALAADKADGTLSLGTPFRLTAERAVLEDLVLEAPGVALRGQIDAVLTGPAVTGRLQGGSSDLRPLGRWLQLPVAGRLDLDVDLTTPDGRQNAKATVTARNLEAVGLRIDRLDVNATATDVLGTLGLDATADVAGLTQGEVRLDRGRVSAKGGLEGLDLALDVAGGLPDPFRLTGAGNVATTEGRTTAALTALDGEVADVPVRLLRRATVRIDGGTIELDGLELEVDTARLRVEGALTPDRVQGRLDLGGFDLGRLVDFGAPALDGLFDLQVRVAGTPSAPTVNGEASIAGLGEAGAVNTLDVTSAFSLGGGRLDADATLAGLGQPPLQATARLPVRFALEPFEFSLPSPLPLDASLVGTLDLASVDNFLALDGQTLEGRLATDLSVAGTVDRPVVRGSMQMADGRIEDVTNGVLLTGVTVDIAAEADRLVLRRIEARDGAEGVLRLSGDVQLGGTSVADLDLALEVDRFAAPQREDLFFELSGNGSVKGTPADLNVVGRFTVDRGEIGIRDGGAASFATLDVVEADAEPANGAADASVSGPANVNLDVVVTVPGRLFVRGRGLVSEWSGEITVTGTAAAPRIVGGIEYRRGYLDLLGQRFDFRKGEIALDGAFPPDPTIDVEAEAELSDIVAVLAISGPALDPDITATSEPPLPQDEVLSRIIFDRGVDRLSPIQALRLAAAVQTLQGGGSGFLDQARNLIGLDTLDFGGDSLDDASMTAGAYVSDGVFVEMKQGLQPGSSQVRVQVELTPRINLDTRVREDQTSSVGLNWSYDY